MIPTRFNEGAVRNGEIRELDPGRGGSGNRRWLEAALAELGSAKDEIRVLLLGGADVVHFHLRVAQSAIRRDRLPSFFSHAVLLDGGPDGGMAHVPILPADAADVPASNAIEAFDIASFNAASRFPNIALLAFAAERADELGATVRSLREQRLGIDFVSPLVTWLGFLWGTQGTGHPLSAGVPVPSALFVDEALSRHGVEITPGLGERSTCPEAIWQAALWWTDFYEQASLLADRVAEDERPEASGRAPRGRYRIRQPEAAARA